MPSPGSFYETLRSRRSVRRYGPAGIPHETALRLLQAATFAPSVHNRQPWRFALVDQAERKSLLARAMGDRLRADRARDGDPADVIEADVARSYERISTAPLVVIACVSVIDLDVYPDARRNEAERTMAVQSVAMACQNLLLAAHAEGLGACWMCAPLFCPETVTATLDLPDDWQPQALLTIGEPANQGKPMSRKPLDTLMRVI